MHEAGALKCLDDGLNRVAPGQAAKLEALILRERLTEQAERIGALQGDRQVLADIEGSVEVHAQLLGERTLHFGDADADHHLFAAADGDTVDHRILA